MSKKIEVLTLINQNNKSMGSFVKYEDYCKLQSDYDDEHDKLIAIIESFTSQSLTDDGEMADTAREIAEILGIKNYR